MNEHALGAGGRYTRGRRPLKLIYLEQHGSYSLAMRREKELKKASPKHKQELLVCGRCGQKKPLKYSKLIASLNREQL
jgi:predicted GIY-YIG superfamily endonuclease